MDAYIGDGELYCGDCVAGDEGDVGPYADGGGEADTPQHCGACGVFLENPLTGDGHQYVVDSIRDYIRDGSGTPEILAEWAEHYDITVHELMGRY